VTAKFVQVVDLSVPEKPPVLVRKTEG